MLPTFSRLSAIASTLAVAVLLLAGPGFAPSPPSVQTDASGAVFEPAIGPRVAPPDTLRRSHPADDGPLVFALPASAGDQSVDAYRVLRAPALSGVADRSFAWTTAPYAPGTYTVVLQSLRNDTPADTLVLEITLE